MKTKLLAPEVAALLDRFLSGCLLYPQEWSDFVEGRKVEDRVEPYRRRCYELDPLVNRPGDPDAKAMEELQGIARDLHNL